jgi:hypothetical protein
MSDNLRRYRAICHALTQAYPTPPTGHFARHVQTLAALISGRTFQCGEGWHSNEHAVRFWHPSPRVPKETAARCYAYTTPYTTMIPLCNVD